MSIEKVLYTAHAKTTGGREGQSASTDGKLSVKLSTRKNWAALAAMAPIRNSCSPRATQPASSAP
jgi:organic hydroperoxide reductase OsmC/OhrA